MLFEAAIVASGSESSARITVACGLAIMLCVLGTNTMAGQVTLAWDPVFHHDLRGYVVYYTMAVATHAPPSGAPHAGYDHRTDVGNTTMHTVRDLADGVPYHFAVTAYYDAELRESGFSNDVVTTVPGAIVADFVASTRMGVVPLAMNFINRSSGIVTTFAWTFGDGGTSSVPHPSHVYALPGVYTVSLSVAGPNGSSTRTVEGCVIVSPPPPIIKPPPKVRYGEHEIVAPSEPVPRTGP